MTLVDAETGEIVATLERCEAVIERGLSSFIEVGDALTAIKDGKLYRLGHDTFELYCQARWGFTARRAHQLMDAAEIGTTVPVSNEAQARALAAAGPEQREEVFEEATRRTNGKPTAAAISEVVHETKTTDRETRTEVPASSPAASAPTPPAELELIDKYGKAMRLFFERVAMFDSGEVADAFAMERDSRKRLADFVASLRRVASDLDAGLIRNQRIRSVK